jgi:acyl-CoA thioesterase I
MKPGRYVFIFSLLILLLSPIAYSQLEKIRVACIGNSITQGGSTTWPGTLQTLLGSHYNVKNFGNGGRTMLRHGDFPYWGLDQFLQAQDFNPHIIFISLGTNDSKSQNWVYGSEFYTDYRDFVHTFKKNGRNPQIYVCFPPPAFSAQYGIIDSIIHDQIIPLIDSIRRTENTLLIDWYTLMDTMSSYFPDGIHPNDAGYAIMGGWARDSILDSPGGFIRTFNANPQKFEKGVSVKLCWETSNGSHVTLNGLPVNETDSMIVNPTDSTPYMLIATGGHYSDTRWVVLEYIAPGTIKTLKAVPPILEQGMGDSSLISWTTSKESVVQFEGIYVPSNGSVYVHPTATQSFTVTTFGEVVDTKVITVPVLPAELINRALLQNDTAYTYAEGFKYDRAVDGDTSTAWVSSPAYRYQWLNVNLGKTYEIQRIVLKWGSPYAISYYLQVWDTLGNKVVIFRTTKGDGGIDDIGGLSGKGIIVRLFCSAISDSNAGGYVLKELEVYTPTRSSGVDNAADIMPQQYELSQNYPNPFNPLTTIKYAVPALSSVQIKVFDILGRQVEEIVNGEKNSGNYIVNWQTNISSGVYFFRMEAKPVNKSGAVFTRTRMMVILK